MKFDKGVTRSDSIEKALEKRIAKIYSEALKTALKNQKDFLKKLADVDSGKIKPPAFYNTPEKIAKWRAGFVRQAARLSKIVEGIAKKLDEAGRLSASEIKSAMAEVYGVNREAVTELVRDGAGINVTFAQYDKRQIDVLLTETQPPFSKIAYKHLGRNTSIRRALQSALAVATINGESQRQIIKRIREITGQSASQARRVAQTERTRVQSQARWEAMNEAERLGVVMDKKWTTRMRNSRPTHIALNGVVVPQDEAFVLIDGDKLRYPGDPRGLARNTINCFCVLVPMVRKAVDA